MKTIKMRKADWEKWDQALRSGEYKQGTEKLYHEYDNSYCCLGVLQHCLTGNIEPDGVCQVPSISWTQKHSISFPDADLTLCNAPFLPSLNCLATEANDSGFFSFIEIADAIKEAVEFIDE